MIKVRFKNRLKHLKEKFYPLTDLGNYEIYNLETVYIYK